MTRMCYLPVSVLYPDFHTNRMIMREVKEPEIMQFDNEKDATLMKQELEKCGLFVTKKKVKIRHDNVSIFFDSGQIFILELFPPEIDVDELSISDSEAYSDDFDPEELPKAREDLTEFLKF